MLSAHLAKSEPCRGPLALWPDLTGGSSRLVPVSRRFRAGRCPVERICVGPIWKDHFKYLDQRSLSMGPDKVLYNRGVGEDWKPRCKIVVTTEEAVRSRSKAAASVTPNPGIPKGEPSLWGLQTYPQAVGERLVISVGARLPTVSRPYMFLDSATQLCIPRADATSLFEVEKNTV